MTEQQKIDEFKKLTGGYCESDDFARELLERNHWFIAAAYAEWERMFEAIVP